MTSFSPVQEPKIRNKGIIRAQLAQNVVALPATAASCGLIAAMRKASALSKEDAAQLTHAARKGLRDTGLYEKGVRAYKIKELPLKKLFKSPSAVAKLFMGKPSKNDKKIINVFSQEIKEGRLYKLLTKKMDPKMVNDIVETNAKRQSMMFKFGLNACYIPKANKIITPDKSLQTSIFHEMGHALNNNGGVVLKSLQKMRPLYAILPSVILLISLLNKRKATDNTKENDSVIQKGADFTKRNAGKLTALAFLPMVLEEGIASLRGQGVAKKLVSEGTLTKDLFKKIKLTNLCGFTSYALAAATAALAIKVAISVKDKIQAKYEAKKMAKVNA